METILKTRHYRLAFYSIVLLASVLLALLRFHTLPELAILNKSGGKEFLALLLEGLLVSLIVTTCIGSFIFWITPRTVANSVMEVVHPKDIGPLLKEATNISEFWIYKGACGRYTRSTTLPKMAAAAKNEGIGRDVSIIIIDPTLDMVCDEYATYRSSLKSANETAPWTRNSVKEEIIGTAVSAALYARTEPLLGVTLHLMQSFSAFRLDISQGDVIVTKEEKTASALRAQSGTYFYKSYKDDVRLAKRQARAIDLSQSKLHTDELTPASIEKFATEVLNISKTDQLDYTRIVELAKNPHSPYERTSLRSSILRTCTHKDYPPKTRALRLNLSRKATLSGTPLGLPCVNSSWIASSPFVYIYGQRICNAPKPRLG